MLSSDPRMDAAFLFGSAARGELRPDSDVDVAVRWVDDETRAAAWSKPLELLGSLGLVAGRDVHLIDLEKADPELRRVILLEGQVLFDRAPIKTNALWARTAMELVDWEYLRAVQDRALFGGPLG